MTRSTEASSAAGKEAPDIAALRLLALEAADGAHEDKRRLMAAVAPVLGVLFRQFLVHDIQTPDWPDRDRFVISPSMQPLACALLHLLGREQHTAEEEAGRADETPPARMAETAACDLSPRGLDLPLHLPGHGLAAAVGMALATRLLRERFGEEIFDHTTCVLVDDGDLEPGIAQEAIAIAPWLRPHRLCVLHMTPVKVDGTPGGRQRCPNHLARFAAAGWHVQQVRAADAEGIVEALKQAADQDVAGQEERRPAYIAVEYDAEAQVPSAAALRQELGWEELPAGDVPGPVRDEWRLVGLRGRKARRAWERRVAELPATERTALQRWLELPVAEEFRQRMRQLRTALAEQARARDLQHMLPALLEESARLMPELVALAALHGELPGGEELPAKDAGDDEEQALAAAAPLLDLGLRPMALAALLTGMAAHGGLRGVGVVRRHQLPAMLPMLDEAGRAGLAVTVLVLEDGRCQRMPLELQTAGVKCLCPADAVELVECWQTCMQQPQGVSLLFVPAGSMAALRSSPDKANLSALGGYELFSSEAPAQVVLYAAGWTLAAAEAAARKLEEDGIAARVVSVPIPQRLMEQQEDHRQRILGGDAKLRLFLPPGEVAHSWGVPGCEERIVPTCSGNAPLPDAATLASKVCEVVRSRLGLPQEGADAAEESAALPESPEEES